MTDKMRPRGRTPRPPYHEYKTVVRRFSMALAANDSIEHLVAGMLGAVVVTMGQMSPDQIQTISGLIDQDKVRVLR